MHSIGLWSQMIPHHEREGVVLLDNITHKHDDFRVFWSLKYAAVVPVQHGE